MTARDDEPEPAPSSASPPAPPSPSAPAPAGTAGAEPEPFERAKWPMVIAAIAVAGGLAIAGSVERTAGGAIVLGAWVLGVGALHRLGRAGSTPRPGDDG